MKVDHEARSIECSMDEMIHTHWFSDGSPRRSYLKHELLDETFVWAIVYWDAGKPAYAQVLRFHHYPLNYRLTYV